MATLGLAGALSPANALVGGKSALDNRTPISETANAGVTEVGRRRGRGFKGRSFKRRGFGGRSYGRRNFSRNRGSFRRKYSNRRSYRRHRYNDLGYALPLLGLGLYLGHQNYAYDRPRYGGGSCTYWRERCADNWGYGNNNYYGCLRYHNCY
ncbi:MAG: hypothetical protein ACFCUR_01500 [Rhodomicrobiaceae bacterium]